MTDQATVMEKGQAVMATVREDAAVVKEALSDIRTEPKGAFAKLLAVAKDIWAKIVEVGLIGAIIESIKNMFGNAASSVSARAANIAAAIPEVPTLQPRAPPSTAAPVASGESTPLISNPTTV